MKFKKILFFLLCISIPLSACSCAESSNKKVAVIAKAIGSDFWSSVKDGVTAAATEYNVDATFEGASNEEDYKAQNRLIEKAVESGADAIVLSAIDRDKSADAVNKAVRKGVKVIAIDSNVSSALVSLFIGTDNAAAGEAAANAAIDGFAKVSNINIGILNCYKSTENCMNREEGFRKYLKTVPNAGITATVTVDSNTESATAGAVKLLREHPEINVLVGFNEWMTLGIGNAIRQTGSASRVRGIGFDTNTRSVSMLETGEMDALIVQNPFAIGYLGVKKASELISGSAGGETTIYTPVVTVTKENLFDKDIQKLVFSFD